jgi:hypothetical protein
MDDKKKKDQELENKLNGVLDKDCKGDECKIKEPEELVHRENKKIITNDGRQLLSEYTTR